MIVLRCEMWPKGDPKQRRTLGLLTITNIGGTVKLGDYRAQLLGRASSVMGEMLLSSWPRQRFNVWDLVTVMLCMLRPRIVKRYRKLWEES